MRKLMSLALALVMSLALAAPAAAADVGTSGNAGSVPVALTAEAAAFSVTVPTSIPMSIDSDAKVTCATNLSITNNTAAPVEVTNIEVQSGTWSIVDYNRGDRSPLASEKVNSNKLGLALKPSGGSQIATSTNGTQSLSVPSDEWVISAGGSLPFECAGVATAVSGAIADAVQAAKVVFTIGWKEASTSPTLISFTICGTIYQAEEGMTWEEWIGSDYDGTTAIFIKNGIVVADFMNLCTIHNSEINATDTIIPNEIYDFLFDYVEVWDASADSDGSVMAYLRYDPNDANGYMLEITGLGDMKNYVDSYAPWCSDDYEIFRITIEDGVTSIGDNAFADFTSLTSVDIPDSLTSIGEFAFADCTSLTSVDILDGVTSIGRYAFRGCTSLTSVDIPNSIEYIGEGAFESCETLDSITIPEGVTSIGDMVFQGCTSLTSITIPEGVSEIDRYAFADCYSLTSITIPESVVYIGDSAFEGCTSLATVNYKGTEEQWSSIAFETNNDSLTSATINYYYEG